MQGATEQRSHLCDFLHSIPLFAELSGAEIDQLIASSRRLSVGSGTQVITEGAVGDTLIVILSGDFEVSKNEDGREITLATRGAGDFLGEMALLEQRPRTASVHAATDGELLEIDAATFNGLLQSNPDMATTILRTVAGRLRSTESSLMQREKLASLGTLAAGLAHELNNPSAAIQRSSAQLADVLRQLDRRTAELAAAGLSETEQQSLAEVSASLTNAKVLRSPVEAMESEDALAETLELLGIDAPWEMAPGLAALGWAPEDLDALAGAFDAPHRTAVIAWVGTSVGTRQLISEIERSARAVSDIVHAVKSYSYLDQAELQDVDVIMSLEDTLMILKHKLRDGITVTRDYAADLPRIEAYGSELNQVWTNLVDNAVDAMTAKGSIEVSARPFEGGVEVRIANSGPPIPPDVARRIFEPFFTTKPQGIGTGLGLHVSHNIIVNRHRGTIDFTSVPGRTEFRVRLPVRLRRKARQ